MTPTEANATHTAELSIPPDHPSLAGHFPGRPVVPGVLLLDRILEAAEDWLGQPVSVRSLPQVKFIAPLLPGQAARLELKRLGDELRFVVRRDAIVIAQGLFAVVIGGVSH